MRISSALSLAVHAFGHSVPSHSVFCAVVSFIGSVLVYDCLGIPTSSQSCASALWVWIFLSSSNYLVWSYVKLLRLVNKINI